MTTKQSAGLLHNILLFTLFTLALGGYGNAFAQTSATLEARLIQLEARESIRELFADYGRMIDERNFSGFATLFATDSEYVGGGTLGAVKGPQAIAAMLEKTIIENASGANLHVFFNEKIKMANDGMSATATSRGAFYVQDQAGQPIPLMFATYIDELVPEGGRWLFHRRQVIGDIPGPSNEARAAARK